MRHLFVLFVLAGCGKVTSAGPDGGAGDGAGPAPGSYVWQRNLFGSFPDAVTIAGDQLYLGASMFSALDLGSGIMVPTGGDDPMVARYTTDGVLQSAWRHGGTSNEDIIGFSIDPSGNAVVGALYSSAGSPGTANVGGADLPPVPVGNNFRPEQRLRWCAHQVQHLTSEPRNDSHSSRRINGKQRTAPPWRTHWYQFGITSVHSGCASSETNAQSRPSSGTRSE